MPDFTTRALDMTTWPDFAALVERHHGVWGGCWCMGFHAPGAGWGKSAEQNRLDKQALVAAGHAHAELVFDGDLCIGWCQFGPVDELPRIKNKKAYEKDLIVLPDWRVTCFFTDKNYRRRGVAAVALNGALDQIARLGGGRVEGYPEATDGWKASGSLLFCGALGTFETAGFGRDRMIGKRRWVVAKTV